MINSNVFDYINVMDKASDAAWTRNEIIANNIANVDTPGYKRQDLNFEDELERALGHNRYKTMDEKVANLKNKHLEARVVNDYSGFSYRTDKNNVDIDTENVMLAANQLKYQGLMSGLKHEFSTLAMVTKSS
ncbi:MAG: flagellar basal body rod protein FlgB [Butyrivibrio sp.]|uniref:flagellar basal body rod protein FlgB n=1 Tax=Butyrivibrio sp. TaxID=28121 RepID=UPI001B5651D1|nr:flagellar basal body rod protein FlgB [Butyrivibrio sp.]MBP3274307.1 flagellar basal body rod protein FlgB [Butyrivibrio sp.]MBP3784122.1 flagellar basal body rod protein FlgB [Butyrivibrio sp.]MBP3814140.1 flagellar basal body rod protein FlgB [Butyrivibrio sp.]